MNEPTDNELIRKLQLQDGEYAKRREFLVRKRSGKFKKIRVTEVCRLKYGNKYIISDYPIEPNSVIIYGAKFEIKDFVVHGRDILWKGGGMNRAPNKIYVVYETYSKDAQ